MKRVFTSLTLCLLIGSSVFSAAQTRKSQEPSYEAHATVSLDPSPPTITREEENELREKLEQALDIPIQINKPEDAPLKIVEAKVRGVKREKRDSFGASLALINDYVMQATIILHNTTGREIARAGLRFTNVQANSVFYIYPKPAEIIFKKRIQVDFMLVTGNPADLVVEVVGAGFTNKETWGAASPSPLPPPPTLTSDVDTKPRLLKTGGHPRYTEFARANRVQGAVRLLVLVAADGGVKVKEVLNMLPDGLTEQAIKTAYQMTFQPAMKNGKTVEAWINLEVEFNLK